MLHHGEIATVVPQSLPTDEFRALKSGRKWRMVMVPKPPPLQLTPRSHLAVVTVVVGAEAEACSAVSGPYMEAYAARLGADFVKLTWPGHPDWPISSKYAIATVLDHYERIIYVDADVLLRNGCLDLAQAVPQHEFGIFNELVNQQRIGHFPMELRLNGFRELIGLDAVESGWYVNAGVMVVPRHYQRHLEPPAFAMPIDHMSEQNLLNVRLQDPANAVRVRFLDEWANTQHWANDFSKVSPKAILHWSGAAYERPRAELMREFAANPLEQPPRPTFCVHVSTTGRSELKRALASVIGQLREGDELIVSFDKTNDWGATPRNRGTLQASSDYIVYLDDDDVFTPDALELARKAVGENPRRPHLFRAFFSPLNQYFPHAGKEVKQGNISTQMLCIPNDKARLGNWTGRYGGYYDFLSSTLEHYGVGSVVWRDEILQVWRPSPTASVDINVPDGTPTITWVSATTPKYQGELDRLKRSFAKMQVGTRLITSVVPDGWWSNTKKFILLTKLLATATTSHVFWIDADCEFVASVDPTTLVHPRKPLSATRHFLFGTVAEHLPAALKGRMGVNGGSALWCQACLFGGTVKAMKELLRRAAWGSKHNSDEEVLNVEWDNWQEAIHVLPGRFACPGELPTLARILYKARAGGPAVIMHHNKTHGTNHLC